jgi:predicted nucleic acid-binding protein
VIPENELVLLDTNVLVAYIRGNKLGEFIEKSHKLLDRVERPLICVVTVGEIKALAHKFGWNEAKRSGMKDLVSELVIVDINVEEVLEKYAAISDYLSKLKPAVNIQQNDMWIASVASVTEAHLITTDKDFASLAPRWIKLHWIDEALAKL